MNTPTIVLIHGWGFDSRVWQTLQTKLNKVNVITIDLPGYGNQINNKTEWNIHNITEDLIARTPGKAIWIGWSLGGLLALYSALHKPTHIKALMTIATTPCFTQKTGWDCAMPNDSFNTFKQSCANDTNQGLNEFKRLVAYGADKPSIKEIRSQKCTASTTTLLSGLEILEHTDLRFELKNIHCPVHSILAENDALIPKAAREPINFLSAENETTFISNAPHGLPISHANVIAQQLETMIHVQ